MNSISISKLKINPSAVIAQAADYPVMVENHNKVEAYLVGRKLYEKMLDLLEDKLDRYVIKQTDFKKGKSLEKLTTELGL